MAKLEKYSGHPLVSPNVSKQLYFEPQAHFSIINVNHPPLAMLTLLTVQVELTVTVDNAKGQCCQLFSNESPSSGSPDDIMPSFAYG